MNTPSVIGITITFADTNAHHLLSLIQAVEPSVDGSCRNFTIQFDQESAGAKLLIGDCNVALAPQRCAQKIMSGESIPFSSGSQIGSMALSETWVVASDAGIVINVGVYE